MKKELGSLIQDIVQFRDDRDWAQFHNPKDLALSISLEAAELLECFQWKNHEEVEQMLQGKGREAVQDEIADIAAYLILLCDRLDIDLLEAISRKMEKNEQKYPVEKAKGRSDKYTEL